MTATVRSEKLKNLGLRIRHVRDAQHVSQQTVAAECNMEKSGMSRIETGHANPTFLTLLKISAALNTTVSQMLENCS